MTKVENVVSGLTTAANSTPLHLLLGDVDPRSSGTTVSVWERLFRVSQGEIIWLDFSFGFLCRWRVHLRYGP